MVQASFMIITYDCQNIFIIQAIGANPVEKIWSKFQFHGISFHGKVIHEMRIRGIIMGTSRDYKP
jgi:hypothetical protein